MEEGKVSDSSGKTSTGIQPNLAGLLCYAGWWVTGIIFLILEKENRLIRFHAVQSIITFGAISVVQFVLGFIPFIGWILSLLIWALSVIRWIVLMLKAYQNQMFKLPIAGDIAEKNS